MPLGGLPTCLFPNCKNVGRENHHVVYASNDSERHYYCRKSRKGNTTVEHGEEIVPLCHRHHQAITDYNERCWRINRYEPLSCAQRRHFWNLFLKNEYPPGVNPDTMPPPTNAGKKYK